jgi:hypothetical protein
LPDIMARQSILFVSAPQTACRFRVTL